MTFNKTFKESILSAINNRQKTIVIPNFIQDQELREAYQICRILDEYLPNYFMQTDEQITPRQINNKIDQILSNFKQEVLASLSKQKDKFREEVRNEKQSFKNIFEFAKCENLYLSNLYTRFISENMGHKLENIAGISNKTFIPEKQLQITIKGIDLIIYDQGLIKYTQLKTKKDTLTGSQSARTINELKIHENSLFVAALDMGNSWTLSKKDCEKYGIQRLAGKSFWSLIGLDYDLILNKLAQVIKEIDKQLYS